MKHCCKWMEEKISKGIRITCCDSVGGIRLSNGIYEVIGGDGEVLFILLYCPHCGNQINHASVIEKLLDACREK